MEDSEILRQLRDGLETGRFVTGGRVLPERQLARMLGIGRTPLRRALDRLKAEGELFGHHGQGTFVVPPPAVETAHYLSLSRHVTPRAIMEVRLAVEPALAALAAERATEAQIATLSRLMRATLGVRDPDSYEAADDVFHFRIAQLSGNPLFLTLFQSIRTVRSHQGWTEERRRSHSPERMRRLGAQHEALLAAIAGRDGALAARRMEEHLRAVERALRPEPEPAASASSAPFGAGGAPGRG